MVHCTQSPTARNGPQWRRRRRPTWDPGRRWVKPGVSPFPPLVVSSRPSPFHETSLKVRTNDRDDTPFGHGPSRRRHRRSGRTDPAESGHATSILNGPFTDMLSGQAPMIVFSRRRVLFWSDPDQVLDFTTKDDTATYTAAACLDESACSAATRTCASSTMTATAAGSGRPPGTS